MNRIRDSQIKDIVILTYVISHLPTITFIQQICTGRCSVGLNTLSKHKLISAFSVIRISNLLKVDSVCCHYINFAPIELRCAKGFAIKSSDTKGGDRGKFEQSFSFCLLRR